MEKQKHASAHISRRGFIKLLTVTLGTSVGAPLLASCAPGSRENKDQYQVNIIKEQSEIHYSPATLTIPRGATVTWLNKSYYSQSATCDPNRAKNGSAASLPKGAPAWDSGLLYPGQRFSKTFDTQGTYVYFSLPMLSPNTIGTIIVK
jgi:plastocyanin